jgi:hypothetical protein
MVVASDPDDARADTIKSSFRLVRQHKGLPVSIAVAMGVSDILWTLREVVENAVKRFSERWHKF